METYDSQIACKAIELMHTYVHVSEDAFVRPTPKLAMEYFEARIESNMSEVKRLMKKMEELKELDVVLKDQFEKANINVPKIREVYRRLAEALFV